MAFDAAEFYRQYKIETGKDTPVTTPKDKAAKEAATDTVDFLKKAALPAAGAALGAFGAPYMAARLGLTTIQPYAPLVGEMLGGGLGEAANQATGISDPSLETIGLNILAPGAGHALAGIPQYLLRMLPGANRAIRAGMVEKARELPGEIQSPGVGYDQIPAMGQPGSFRLMDLYRTGEAAHALQREINTQPLPALTPPEYGTRIQPLLEQIDERVYGTPPQTVMRQPTVGGKALPQSGLPKQKVQTAPGVPQGFDLDEVLAVKESLGKLIRDTKDGTLRGAYKQLYRSLLEDLENLPAPAGTAVETWKAAQQTYKKELARADLADLIETKGIKSVEGVDQFQADAVLNALKSHKGLQKRLSQKELNAIETALRDMAHFTGKRDTKLLSLLLGTASTGTAGGAVMGYLGADMIANALLQPGIRKMFTKLATAGKGNKFGDAGAILAAGIAGALGNDPTQE